MIKLSHKTEITPWPHQKEAIHAFRESLRQGKGKMAFIMATATGKTEVAIWCVDKYLKEYGAHRVLFISHLEQIWSQLDKRFEDTAPHISRGFFMAGTERALKATVINASVETLSRRIKRGALPFTRDHFKMIVVDEFHHAATNTYKTVLEYFHAEVVIGMSCIKERSDQKDFMKHFGNNIVYELDTVTAIQRGAIAGLKYIALKDDIDYRIYSNGYTYRETDQNRKLLIPKKDKRVIERWLEIALGKKTIVFCANVRHSDRMMEYMRAMGISAMSIHYRTSREEIKTRTDGFRNGKYQVACTIDQWLEGADFPEAEVALFLRPTKSWRVFVQARGRILRRIPGVKETGIVIDAVGTHKWVGLYKRLIEERQQFETFSAGRGGDPREVLDFDPGKFELDIEEVKDILEQTGERQVFTKEQAVAAYRELDKKLGRQPTYGEYTGACYSPYVIDLLYGHPGWRSFLQSMGLEAIRSANGITKEKAVDAFNILKKKLGRQPTGREYCKVCFSEPVLMRLYGRPAWRRFLQSMGLEALTAANITKEKAVESFNVLAKNLGRQPTSMEYGAVCFGLQTLERLYGRPSWHNFLQNMGLDPMSISRRGVTKEKAVDAFNVLEKKLGRQPTGRKYGAVCFGLKTLERLYGRPGWRNFLKDMGRITLSTRPNTASKARRMAK